MSEGSPESSAVEPTRSSAGARSELAGNVHVLSYGFNQDSSCFVCGTTAGFRVFTASPITEVHRREQTGAFEGKSVTLVSMLYRTNIFAMVIASHEDGGAGEQHRLQLWNDQSGKFVGELRSRNEVLGVALRRDVIAMVCEYAIYLYTLDKLRVILHLTTHSNPGGLCALATASEQWVLCCPGQSPGLARVQVGQDGDTSVVIEAHRTTLAALALNPSGSLVATASEKGTVVKVFQRSGQLLYRLRRSTRPATISCLTFRADDKFLAVGSSSATVHVFKLDPATAEGGPGQEAPSAGGQTVDQIASHISNAVTRLTSQAAADAVTDAVRGVVPAYFNDLRSFAQFRIPDLDSGGQPSVDVRSRDSRIGGPQIAFHKSEPRFSVLHYSGTLYECIFKPDQDPGHGVQNCGFHSATTWFAVRPDFKVQTQSLQLEGNDDDGDEWQVL